MVVLTKEIHNMCKFFGTIYEISLKYKETLHVSCIVSKQLYSIGPQINRSTKDYCTCGLVAFYSDCHPLILKHISVVLNHLFNKDIHLFICNINFRKYFHVINFGTLVISNKKAGYINLYCTNINHS